MIITLSLIAFGLFAAYFAYCMHTAPEIDEDDDDYPHWI